MKIYEEDLYEYPFDPADFIDACFSAGIEVQQDENGFYYEIPDTDADGNGIADFLDELMGNPVVTNPTQTGAGG